MPHRVPTRGKVENTRPGAPGTSQCVVLGRGKRWYWGLASVATGKGSPPHQSHHLTSPEAVPQLHGEVVTPMLKQHGPDPKSGQQAGQEKACSSPWVVFARGEGPTSSVHAAVETGSPFSMSTMNTTRIWPLTRICVQDGGCSDDRNTARLLDPSHPSILNGHNPTLQSEKANPFLLPTHP